MIIKGTHCQLEIDLGRFKINDYDPIAHAYDSAMGNDFAAIFFPQLLGIIKTYLGNINFKYLDLGCGTGNLINLVSKEFSAECFGIDLSSNQIRIGQEKSPTAKFICGDILDVEFPTKIQLIAMTLDALNHITTPEGWRVVFEKAYNALDKNGIFIFDINTPRRLVEDWALPEVIVKESTTYVQCPLGHDYNEHVVRGRILMLIYERHKHGITEHRALIEQMAMPEKNLLAMLHSTGFKTIREILPMRANDSGHIFIKNRVLVVVHKK